MFDSDNDRMCVSIPLLSDNLLEQTEAFEAVLTSDDPDVTLTPEVAAISILDTNGMNFCRLLGSSFYMLVCMRVVMR